MLRVLLIRAVPVALLLASPVITLSSTDPVAPTLSPPPVEVTQPAPPPTTSSNDLEQRILAAASDGRLTYRVTRPPDLVRLLGEPAHQKNVRRGELDIRVLAWPGIVATFARSHQRRSEFTLYQLGLRKSDDPSERLEELDIGQDHPYVLRDLHDLDDADRIFGLSGLSLVRLDLREQNDRLRTLGFDSRTIWPVASKLPTGFEPSRILENGKNPGLGVRGLHQQGIDGRGVHVAIIDQPLLLDHREYAGHIERYVLIGTYDAAVEMHGPPVTSVLIGRDVGVAPAAHLSYYAVPMWKQDNAPFTEALEQVLDRNASVPLQERIRVVSISTGMFPQWANLQPWRAICSRAEQEGVLVLTCEQSEDFRYAALRRRQGDPDDPARYRRGSLFGPRTALGVPSGGRTTASHKGPDVYAYWTIPGMSWCTPYLAGVAALGFQVDPALTPARARQLLKETAHAARAGLVVNPPGFVAAVRAANSSSTR